MSEAARRTYFHFTPTSRGEWKTSPPEDSGLYWVAWASASGAADSLGIVHYQTDQESVEPVGWELFRPDEPVPALKLSQIAAWWSTAINPPPLPK